MSDSKMKITVEKVSQPWCKSRPWGIFVDGKLLSWDYSSKKKAIAIVEATGNIVSNC